MSQSDVNELEAGESASSRANKRRKQETCIACQRKKIKCSRTKPCAGCVTRGQPEACIWYDEPPGPVDYGHAVSQAAFQQFAAETNTALLRLSESVRELRQGIVLGDLRTERAEVASSEDRRAPWTKSTVLSYSHSKKEEQLSYLHETSSALDQVTQAAVLEDIKPLHAGLPPSLERDLTQSLEGFALSSILNEHDTVSPAYLTSPLPWLRSKTPWHAATGLRSLLASQYHAENLLRGHFSTLRLTMYIVHQPALLRESAAFWALLDDQLHLVDPAWLALYASLLAVPAAHRPGYAGVSQALAEIALACLDMSGWHSTPQIRTVQTFMCLRNRSDPHNAHLSQAFRAAITLRLHELRSPLLRRNFRDKSLPYGSLLASELPIRLWCELVSFDETVASYHSGHVRHILAYEMPVQEPRSLSETELDVEDVAFQGTSLQPPSALIITPGSAILLRSKIGRLRRYQVSLDEPEFQISVAVYSSRVRQVQEACEEYARWLGNRQPCTQPSFEQEIWLACLGKLGIFNVQIRLHRCLAVKGITDPSFAKHFDIVVESGQATLRWLCRPELQDHIADGGLVDVRPATIVICRYAWSAITAVLLAVLHKIDLDGAAVDWQADVDTITEVGSMFASMSASALPGVAMLSQHIHTLSTEVLTQTIADCRAVVRRRQHSPDDTPLLEYVSILSKAVASVSLVRHAGTGMAGLPGGDDHNGDPEQARRGGPHGNQQLVGDALVSGGLDADGQTQNDTASEPAAALDWHFFAGLSGLQPGSSLQHTRAQAQPVTPSVVPQLWDVFGAWTG